MIWPYVFPVTLIVVLALFAVAALGMCGYVVYWYLRNWMSPTTRVRAKVLRKRHKQWDVTITGETPEMEAARLGMLGRDPRAAAEAYSRLAASQDAPELTLAEGTDCYITFALDRGGEVELNVPMATYIAAEEGSEGLLIYRGEQFLHFIAFSRPTA